MVDKNRREPSATAPAIGRPERRLPPAMTRNRAMIARIEQTPVRYPFRFLIAGDTGFGPNEAGDAVFVRLLARMDRLAPKPVFFANLGDFAGPGTSERHAHYGRMIQKLSIPNLCVMGNHELDDPAGRVNFERIIGPANFHLTYGNTLFVAIRSYERRGQPHGPDTADLRFLEETLRADHGRHPVKILLMHMPPNMQGHYAPHTESAWAFTGLEPDFWRMARSWNLTLICSAHITGFDRYEHNGVRILVSGAGGGAVNRPPYDTIFDDLPPRRGGFVHFVEITVHQSGNISGRVFRLSGDRIEPDAEYDFQ